MPYVGKPFAEIVQTGDYMTIFCSACKTACSVDRVAMHAHIPILKIECAKCGLLSESKLGSATAQTGFIAKM
jgi:hypothetical protein